MYQIVGQIDLCPDKIGNISPFSIDGKGMHYHNFSEIQSNTRGRKSGQKDNHYPIPYEYEKLVENVIKFNKKQRQ